MILCLAKNDRAAPLFKALTAIDTRYIDGGIVGPSPSARALGLLLSASKSPRVSRNHAQFSRPLLRSYEAACAARIARFGDDISSVLAWGAMGRPVSRRSQIPYYVVTDGPYDPGDRGYPLEWSPGRWSKDYLSRQHDVFGDAVKVFTLSRWARDKVMSVHGLAGDRVEAIGWGPMESLGPPLLDPESTCPYFVSVGNEWKRKGMDVVARAAALLQIQFPDVQTYIVGNPAGLSIQPTAGVRLIPRSIPIPAVQALLRQATGTIVASRFDASPHVIFESLQYGTPVIGADVCGIPEAVNSPAGGRIFDPNNAHSLAEAMADLLRGVSRGQRRSALMTYQTLGQWSKMAERIISSIDQVRTSERR